MSLYPFPNQRYTSQLGLALYGMDEVLAENMLLIDGTFSAGSTVFVNSALVTSPNFNNTTPAAPAGKSNVIWQVDINGNVSAYVPTPAAGGVTSLSGDSVVYDNSMSVGAVTLSLISQVKNTVFSGPAAGSNAAPTFRALVSADLANTIVLASGIAATTQPPIDNSTLIATDAFVQTAVELSMATVPLSITGGTYSFASLGVNALVNYTATAGAITAITIWIPFVGSGYAIGDIVTPAGGNYDAMIVVTAISGAGAPTAGTILYGGTGYTSGTSKAAGVTISVPYTWLLSGTLTSNATFIMTPGTYLTQSNQWIFCNNTTGAFTVTVGVAAPGTDAPSGGRTVVIPQGANNSRSVLVQTDGELNTDLCGIINGADLTVGALSNGMTATTQSVGDNSTKLATTAFVLGQGFGSGTVTSFSAGNLSPLFTTSVATATTTPALSFSLSNAAGGTVFGNATTSAAAPGYTIAPVLGIPGTSTGSIAIASSTASGKYTITAPANAATPTLTLPTGTGTFCVSASSPLTLNATTGNMTFSGSGAITWDQIGNAAANLTLANAAFTTTFQQTANTIWLWQNTTTATSGTTNASPLLELAANYWTGAASATDTWSIGSSLAAGTNGASTLTIAHSGSTGIPICKVLGVPITSDGNGTRINSIGTLGGISSEYIFLNSGNGIGFGKSPAAANAILLAGVYGFCAVQTATNSADTGISRVGVASLAIGNGTAGDTTGNLSFGTVAKYNGTATVRNGIAAEYASSDLTAQSAAITATTLLSAPQTGMYKVSWSATITTASDISSVLGGTNGFQVIYTSPTDSVAKTTVPGNSVTCAQILQEQQWEA